MHWVHTTWDGQQEERERERAGALKQVRVIAPLPRSRCMVACEKAWAGPCYPPCLAGVAGTQEHADCTTPHVLWICGPEHHWVRQLYLLMFHREQYLLCWWLRTLWQPDLCQYGSSAAQFTLQSPVNSGGENNWVWPVGKKGTLFCLLGLVMFVMYDYLFSLTFDVYWVSKIIWDVMILKLLFYWEHGLINRVISCCSAVHWCCNFTDILSLVF